MRGHFPVPASKSNLTQLTAERVRQTTRVWDSGTVSRHAAPAGDEGGGVRADFTKAWPSIPVGVHEYHKEYFQIP